MLRLLVFAFYYSTQLQIYIVNPQKSEEVIAAIQIHIDFVFSLKINLQPKDVIYHNYLLGNISTAFINRHINNALFYFIVWYL